jgi:hypothetical protein
MFWRHEGVCLGNDKNGPKRRRRRVWAIGMPFFFFRVFLILTNNFYPFSTHCQRKQLIFFNQPIFDARNQPIFDITEFYSTWTTHLRSNRPIFIGDSSFSTYYWLLFVVNNPFSTRSTHFQRNQLIFDILTDFYSTWTTHLRSNWLIFDATNPFLTQPTYVGHFHVFIANDLFSSA